VGPRRRPRACATLAFGISENKKISETGARSRVGRCATTRSAERSLEDRSHVGLRRRAAWSARRSRLRSPKKQKSPDRGGRSRVGRCRPCGRAPVASVAMRRPSRSRQRHHAVCRALARASVARGTARRSRACAALAFGISENKKISETGARSRVGRCRPCWAGARGGLGDEAAVHKSSAPPRGLQSARSRIGPTWDFAEGGVVCATLAFAISEKKTSPDRGGRSRVGRCRPCWAGARGDSGAAQPRDLQSARSRDLQHISLRRRFVLDDVLRAPGRELANRSSSSSRNACAACRARFIALVAGFATEMRNGAEIANHGAENHRDTTREC
jgi:hypothetical protein